MQEQEKEDFVRLLYNQRYQEPMNKNIIQGVMYFDYLY